MSQPQEDWTQKSDEELMLVIADSSAPASQRAATEELCKRWYPRLVRCASRLLQERKDAEGELTAEDLAQATICRLMERAKGFDSHRLLRPWLFMILYNLVRDYWRSRKKRRSAGNGDSLFAREVSPLEQLAWQEALGRLDASDQELFWAYYLEGEAVADISVRLGWQPGKVYKRLRELRQQILASIRPVTNPKQERAPESLSRPAHKETPVDPSGGWTPRCSMTAVEALYRALQEKN
jgi:RNA polymerase sigma factor (sigma-70 family)